MKQKQNTKKNWEKKKKKKQKESANKGSCGGVPLEERGLGLLGLKIGEGGKQCDRHLI